MTSSIVFPVRRHHPHVVLAHSVIVEDRDKDDILVTLDRTWSVFGIFDPVGEYIPQGQIERQESEHDVA